MKTIVVFVNEEREIQRIESGCLAMDEIRRMVEGHQMTFSPATCKDALNQVYPVIEGLINNSVDIVEIQTRSTRCVLLFQIGPIGIPHYKPGEKVVSDHYPSGGRLLEKYIQIIYWIISTEPHLPPEEFLRI